MPSTAMRAEAATWLARLKADDSSAADRIACEAWLARSKFHRQALAEVTEAWEVAGALSIKARDPVLSRAPGRRQPDRRGFILAGLAGAAGAAVWTLNAPHSYATEIGEVRRFSLDDGSSVLLDANSKVTINFSQSLRRLDLMRGRVAVTIASDSGRPFIVVNQHRRILALGRALEVSRRGADLSVTSMDGPALVQGVGSTSFRLAAGDRLQQTAGGLPHTDRPVLSTETAWQTGRLIFENETLANATSEINQYNRRPIVLGDAYMEILRVSGVYRSEEGDDFARSIATLFNLQVVEEPSRILLKSGAGSSTA